MKSRIVWVHRSQLEIDEGNKPGKPREAVVYTRNNTGIKVKEDPDKPGVFVDRKGARYKARG